MRETTKEKLVEAWDWCDAHDKSTGFMLQYMADTADVEFDVVVEFVCDTTPEERRALSKLVNS